MFADREMRGLSEQDKHRLKEAYVKNYMEPEARRLLQQKLAEKKKRDELDKFRAYASMNAHGQRCLQGNSQLPEDQQEPIRQAASRF